MDLTISPEVPGDRVIMDQRCPWCEEDHLINMPASLYFKWRTRADLIQNIFPDTPADEREVIKTGYCPDCWSEMFGA